MYCEVLLEVRMEAFARSLNWGRNIFLCITKNTNCSNSIDLCGSHSFLKTLMQSRLPHSCTARREKDELVAVYMIHPVQSDKLFGGVGVGGCRVVSARILSVLSGEALLPRLSLFPPVWFVPEALS